MNGQRNSEPIFLLLQSCDHVLFVIFKVQLFAPRCVQTTCFSQKCEETCFSVLNFSYVCSQFKLRRIWDLFFFFGSSSTWNNLDFLRNSLVQIFVRENIVFVRTEGRNQTEKKVLRLRHNVT